MAFSSLILPQINWQYQAISKAKERPRLIDNKRDSLAPVSFPFLHKSSGILSEPWVLSVIPSHATFPFIIAPSDFSVLLFLQLLIFWFHALWVPLDATRETFAWGNKTLRCVVNWVNFLWDQIDIPPFLVFNWQRFHVTILVSICYVHNCAGPQGSLGISFSLSVKKWYHQSFTTLDIKIRHYSWQTARVCDPALPFLTIDLKL